MANFFTRALDRITPWNRGGEVQRRKKREEEQQQPNNQNQATGLTVKPTQPTPRMTVDQPLTVQQPVNVFDANKNLALGAPRPGVIPVFKTPDTQPTLSVQPGAVVQPSVQKPRTVEDDINDGLNAGKSWEQISRETNVGANDVKRYSESTRPNYGVAPVARPKQSFGNRIRDAFDANTEADKFRRQEGNKNLETGQQEKAITLRNPGSIISRTPIVGHVVKTLNTLTNQAAEIPATIDQVFQTKLYSDLSKELIEARKSGNSMRVNEANRKMDLLLAEMDKNKTQQDVNHGVFQKNKGGLFNAGTLYDEEASQRGDIKTGLKDIAAPTAVSMLDLYTLGQGNLISEGLKEGIPKVGFNTAVRKVAPNIVRAGVGNYASGDIGARSEGASNSQAVKSGIINSILGTIPDIGLPALFNGFKSKILPSLLGGRGVPTRAATQELDDAAISASAEAAIEATRPRPIPIRQNIPINEIAGEAARIPVNVAERAPGNLIQEVTGDAATTTPSSAIADKVAEIRRGGADAINKVGVPDRAVEGVTPGTPTRPFVLTPETVATGQAKIIDDYADVLRGMGEGNGTQLVPDGEGGYTRTSNNFRSADNAGKRMTKAAWREEAEKQLAGGKAMDEVQKAFNDAADPEVQAMLAKGEQPDVPIGRPIEVKQATGIPVTDQTVVPQGLPEKPGTVRAIEATAPSNAKAAAAAVETPPVAPVAKVAETVPTSSVAGAAAENLPRPDEPEDVFLKRVAEDMQSNIKRAVESLKTTKKMTKAERAQRAAAGETAYQEAKAAGKSAGEQEAARKAAYSGSFDRMDYSGAPIHSADEQRLRDMVDEHYKDMPYQAGNVREAFQKLFHSGEPGWASEAGNHIILSDIKNIRKFLNESVPNVDGNGGLGDFAEAAIKDLAAADPGPGKIANAIGLQRALRFTADISATGRQALPGALSHPVEFAKAAKRSFEVMFSHDKYQKFVSELANDKEANYINDRLGAYLSVLNDDISKADDIYRNSGWAHKIPGVNKVVAASERQYNALLSGMRYQAGKRFIDAAGGIAQLEKIASESGNPDTFLKAIGTVANVNTGRGFGKALDSGSSKILSDVLVSPRGLAAKLQRFNPKYYIDLMKANPAAGKEALRSLGIQTAVTASALGAANASGLYEDGQIKIGNTRYDITGGAANMIRTAVRVAQFMSGDRQTTPFSNAESEVTRWARNQLAPFLASSLDAIGIHQDPKSGTWVNRWGDDVTLTSTVLDNIAPVNASQVSSDLKLDTPGAQTAANAALNTLGIGVNSYQSTADKSLPKEKSLRDTYKQLTKEGIGTSATDVNDYIAGGDYDKAIRAAEYNLQALQADPSSGDNQIKKAERTLQEIKLRQDGVPMTDDGITAKVEDGNWDTAIKGYQWKIEKAKADGELSKKTEQGIQNDITRAEVARDSNIDPGLLSSYKSTSETDWRKMGIPPGDKNYDPDFYDPEMYQKLWDIDQRMTKAGASYKEGKLDKNKYSAKKDGEGSGGKSIDTSFGTLKAGSFAPQVRQYDSIDGKSGSVPIIRTVRPNIVHKISSS